MKGDFTRTTFRRDKHYSGVRLQQGRVQVDADWNEQVDIAAHRDETTTYDVLGDCAGPVHDAGFKMVVSGSDLHIGAGRYYVDGVLCENEDVVAFHDQPDLPEAGLPTDPGTYLAYLDVWNRHITALEDGSLREVALGGPDTATRTRTIWQVKLEEIDPGDTCIDFGADWEPAGSTSSAMLRARSSPAPPDLDECVVPPGSGYRRLENQLYRIEIHEGGAGASFKWSRDNGTIVARLEMIEGDELTVSTSGPDSVLSFMPGQSVELSDENRVLAGEPGVLVELASVDGNVLTVAAWPGSPLTIDDFGSVPTVRRWDSQGTIDVDPGDFIELEDGVEVEFSAGDLNTGDFWLLPARSLTGNVEWPQNGAGPEFRPREGIEHHFCPVAILELDGDGTTWSLISDCRSLFPPLTEFTSLYYVGGDGQEAMPDPTQPDELIALPRAIEVGVANGEWPVEGATIRFEITDGAGGLEGAGATVDVTTGADGIASAAWALDSTTQLQTATATLLDASDSPHHLQIRFSANLSVAELVAYDPGTCTALDGAVTVQTAIDVLSSRAHLYYLSGDGQEGLPGATLEPLRVTITNECGPLEGAKVRFAVKLGDGTLDGAGDTVEILTDGGGAAECTWTLGSSEHRQRVDAMLIDAAGNSIGEPMAASFNANLSLATQVAYDPSKCPDLAEADTVQEAIDLLCGREGGVKPAIQVERVMLDSGQILRNDDDFHVAELARGIVISCDQFVDENSVRGKPVVMVVLDLPFPLADDDAEMWGQSRVGTVPLTLGSRNDSDDNDIFWIPSEDTAHWLAEVLHKAMERLEVEFLLAHLILKGNFIWSRKDPDIYIDGDVFGEDDHGATRVRLPSGDGQRGGDLEMWFRLHRG